MAPVTTAPAPMSTPTAPAAAPTPAASLPPVTASVPTAAQPGAAAAGVALPPIGVPRPDGSLALTPEGDMRYRQAVVAGREALGPVPRVFKHASLPELPYELGQHNWNPFTSSWSDPAAGDGGGGGGAN